MPRFNRTRHIEELRARLEAAQAALKERGASEAKIRERTGDLEKELTFFERHQKLFPERNKR